MKRCLLLLTLLTLPGCDVAVAALIFSSNSDSSDDDPVPLTSPGLGDEAVVWVAQIPDAAAATIERANLVNQNGNPAAPWTKLGELVATEIFDPSPALTFNAILIQVGSDENFNIDAIELLPAIGNEVVGHASGATYASFVQPENEILGPPDGVCAVTTASGAVRAFIFTLYSTPVERFRVNSRGQSQPPLPSDVLAKGGGLPQFGESHLPGGMAVDANGLVYLTNSRGDVGYLTLFDVGSLTLPTVTTFDSYGDVQISADLATAGSHCVAVNSAGVMFTACSNAAGVIQVRKFNPAISPATDPVPVDSVGFSSGFNGDRVEHNGIAVDQSGNVVVVGGFSSLLSGRNHWRVKLPDTISNLPIWQSLASLDSSSTTYWHAVSTVGDDAFITGDLLSSLLGGTNQIYTSFFNTAGVPTSDDTYQPGESLPDVGHSIATDASGNIYIGGYASTASGGRNGILVRYAPGFATERDTPIQGSAGLNDEILDIAVDTDGSIFVVGYETTAAQGENMLVRKYSYDTANDTFNLVWSRTHDGGFGSDRAVSVVIYGNYLIVAGYETDSSADTVIVIRVYAK